MTPPLADGLVADALSGVASALEVPVHVAALVLLVLLALEVGRGLTELWRRRGPGRRPLWTVARDAVADPRQAPVLARRAPTPLAGRAVESIGSAVATGRPGGIDDALTEYELGVQRRLDGTRLLVRAAPALGLMGTLIPLAPGLEALGRGDIGALAADLRTAFAATVVGLLVGTVSFALTLVRTRVYTEDLAALERAVAPLAATSGARDGEREPSAPTGGTPLPGAAPLPATVTVTPPPWAIPAPAGVATSPGSVSAGSPTGAAASATGAAASATGAVAGPTGTTAGTPGPAGPTAGPTTGPTPTDAGTGPAGTPA